MFKVLCTFWNLNWTWLFLPFDYIVCLFVFVSVWRRSLTSSKYFVSLEVWIKCLNLRMSKCKGTLLPINWFHETWWDPSLPIIASFISKFFSEPSRTEWYSTYRNYQKRVFFSRAFNATTQAVINQSLRVDLKSHRWLPSFVL